MKLRIPKFEIKWDTDPHPVSIVGTTADGLRSVSSVPSQRELEIEWRRYDEGCATLRGYNLDGWTLHFGAVHPGTERTIAVEQRGLSDEDYRLALLKAIEKALLQ